MDDGGKQVSWLVAWSPPRHLPGPAMAAGPVVSTRGAPLTVAGAARASHPSSHL